MFEFKVIPDGGEPYELTATSRDVYTWERISKGRNLRTLRDGIAMADLYELAWIAARRQGLTSADTLRAFSDCTDLEFEEEEDQEEPDPTNQDRSATG